MPSAARARCRRRCKSPRGFGDVGRADPRLERQGRPCRRLARAGRQGRADAGVGPGRQDPRPLLQPARPGRADRHDPGAQHRPARRAACRRRQGRRRRRRRRPGLVGAHRVPGHRFLARVGADRCQRQGERPGHAARQPDHLGDGRPGRDRRHPRRPVEHGGRGDQGAAAPPGAAALLHRRRQGRDRGGHSQHDEPRPGRDLQRKRARPALPGQHRRRGDDPRGRDLQGCVAGRDDSRRRAGGRQHAGGGIAWRS